MNTCGDIRRGEREKGQGDRKGRGRSSQGPNRSRNPVEGGTQGEDPSPNPNPNPNPNTPLSLPLIKLVLVLVSPMSRVFWCVAPLDLVGRRVSKKAPLGSHARTRTRSFLESGVHGLPGAFMNGRLLCKVIGTFPDSRGPLQRGQEGPLP